MSIKSKMRFFKKVLKTDYCWIWRGSVFKQGYGKLKLNGKDGLKAHRISYMIHFGNIPGELCVLHKCDNKICVNPSHLFLGTRAENNTDRSKKFRSAHGMKNPNCKTPLFIVSEIKDLYLNKIPQTEIAGRFKISQTLVSLIVNNKQRVFA